MVCADLAPDVPLRGFSLGVFHEPPLVLVAAEAAGTLSAGADFVDVPILAKGTVATAVLGEDPGRWLEGADLPVLLLVHAAPGVDPVTPPDRTA